MCNAFKSVKTTANKANVLEVLITDCTSIVFLLPQWKLFFFELQLEIIKQFLLDYFKTFSLAYASRSNTLALIHLKPNFSHNLHCIQSRDCKITLICFAFACSFSFENKIFWEPSQIRSIRKLITKNKYSIIQKGIS